LFSAQFIGSPKVNVWAIDGRDGVWAREVAGSTIADGGGGLLIGVRPEHVEVGRGELRAEVTLTEPLGRDALVHLAAGPSEIRALVPAAQGGRLEVGQQVPVQIEPAHLLLFDAESGRRVDIGPSGQRQLDDSVG